MEDINTLFHQLAEEGEIIRVLKEKAALCGYTLTERQIAVLLILTRAKKILNSK